MDRIVRYVLLAAAILALLLTAALGAFSAPRGDFATDASLALSGVRLAAMSPDSPGQAPAAAGAQPAAMPQITVNPASFTSPNNS